MTRLALGLKCGCLGARGLVTADAVAPLAFSGARSDERAIEPSPTPHWRKNQRRVISLAYSQRSSCSRVNISSLFGYRFVEVQDSAADHRPSGDFMQVDLRRHIGQIRGGDFHGSRGIVLEVVILLLPEG